MHLKPISKTISRKNRDPRGRLWQRCKRREPSEGSLRPEGNLRRVPAALFVFFVIFGITAFQCRFIALADDSSSSPADASSSSATSDTQNVQTDNSTNASVTSDNTNSTDGSSTDASDTDAGLDAVPPTPPDVSSTMPDVSSTPDIAVPSSTPTSSDAIGTDAADGTDANPAADAASSNTDAPTDGTLISTGDASAVANVQNVVNTNIVNAQGFADFINLLQPLVGNIDLSNLDFQPTICSTCAGGSLTVDNSSTADVTNDISVTADTGSNAIADASDGSTIATGGAAAAANVLNVVDSNIVNSNYLLLVMNNFSQMTGDLILPGAAFFNDFLDPAPVSTPSTAVANDNTATVGNNLSITADTGSNDISDSSGSSSITTGDSVTASNVVNLVNSNVTTNNQVYILVRVFGTWNGTVFSAPPGLSWNRRLMACSSPVRGRKVCSLAVAGTARPAQVATAHWPSQTQIRRTCRTTCRSTRSPARTRSKTRAAPLQSRPATPMPPATS